MEDEIETNVLDQAIKHEDLQLEILKLEAALNMTVSHWKELKNGHSEFADKTLDMLKDILDMASTPATESSTSKDDIIDDILNFYFDNILIISFFTVSVCLAIILE